MTFVITLCTNLCLRSQCTFIAWLKIAFFIHFGCKFLYEKLMDIRRTVPEAPKVWPPPILLSPPSFWKTSGTHHTDQWHVALRIFHAQFRLSFFVNQYIASRLLQNFGYATTAQLSWHEQNFVVISSPDQDISVEFYLWLKKNIVSVMVQGFISWWWQTMRDISALLTFLYSVNEWYWAVDRPHILPVT